MKRKEKCRKEVLINGNILIFRWSSLSAREIIYRPGFTLIKRILQLAAAQSESGEA